MEKLNARPEPQPARRHVSSRSVDPACGRKEGRTGNPAGRDTGRNGEYTSGWNRPRNEYGKRRSGPGHSPGREQLPQPVLVRPGKRLPALLRRREPWGHANAALTSPHCNRSSRLEYNRAHDHHQHHLRLGAHPAGAARLGRGLARPPADTETPRPAGTVRPLR